MSERVFPSSSDSSMGFPLWGAIWAGTFTFVAIWSVLGFLGAAIFASVASPAHPLATMGVGMAIWAVVLTVIAMFAGGRMTGSLSGRTNATMTGTALFGLSVTAGLAIAFLARLAFAVVPVIAGALGVYSVRMLAGLGWTGFIALLLGWFAAVLGASSATPRRMVEAPVEGQVRRVA